MIVPLKRYAQFTGRSSRREIWWYFLGYVALWTVMIGGVIASGLGASGSLTDGNNAFSVRGITSILLSLSTFGLVLFFLWLGLLLPTLAVQVRRLRDLEMSGWWLTITWAPFFVGNVITYIALASQSFVLVVVATWTVRLSWVLFVVLLALYCRPGFVGENDYGLDPTSGGADLAETFQ